MKYDQKKRVFLIKMFYKLENITLVQRAFRSEYPKEDFPNGSTIKNLVSNFEKTGSVGHVAPKPKNPSQKREIAKNQLKTMVQDFGTFSLNKAASAIGVSRTLVYHILHDDLHLKPYKFHLWHKLEDQDYQKRVDFATWFLKIPLSSRPYFFLVTKLIFI